MLKSLRQKTSGFVAKLILAVVVLAFVVTGFSGFFAGTPSGTVVEAGRTQLGLQDYLLAWRQAEASIAQRIQRRPSREEARALGIDSQVMSQLVSEAVLQEEARHLGLGLSEERLAQLIRDDPSFRDGAGNFSRNEMRQLLANVGMSENQFIENRGQAAVRSQVVDAVARGATAPAIVRTAFGIYGDEKRTVDYVTLPPSLAGTVPEPSGEALATYFEANKQRYRAPEYRSVSYVLMTPEALSNEEAVTDEQVAADYEAGRQRYTTPERRRVQQVLFPNLDAANAAKARLSAGGTFEELATANGRTLADADLGFRTKAELPDRAIADAAFALGANGVSDVVPGAFGPVLLRVTEIQPETAKPLAEVRDQIRRELALQTAGQQLAQAQTTFDDARAGGATLTEAAQRAGLTVRTVPAVSRTGQGPNDAPAEGLPTAEGFLDAVFTAETGQENQPIILQPSGSLAYEVTKIDPARDRPLDEVRARVVEDWTTAETQRLLGERAEALKKRLDNGETLDAIAASEGLTKETAQAVTRRSGVAALGEAGVRAAFAGKAGLTAIVPAPDAAARLLLKVETVAPPLDPVAAVPAGDGQRLDQLVENDFLQAYVDVLRRQFDAVSYPDAVERAQAAVQ